MQQATSHAPRNLFQDFILGAFQRQIFEAKIGRTARPKHMYAGTVPPAVVERRRAANKVARASRRLNRAR